MKEKREECILGLDISTTCTGWCVVDLIGNLIEMGSIELSELKDQIFLKADLVRDNLKLLDSKFNIKAVFIEENLQAFQPGKSSAGTIVKLARFNGIVSFICFDVFKSSQPIFLNVATARKFAGCKIDFKNKEKSTKEKVLDWVSHRLPEHVWATRKKKNGDIVPVDSCFDAADAYVIASAGSHIVRTRAKLD